MGIATQQLLPVLSHSKFHHQIQVEDKSISSNSMSQDYHQGIFSFSNGFERSVMTHHEQHQHIAQQIRRDKLRVQGYEQPPPPLIGIEEEESSGLPVYDTGGMSSEMFNFPSGGTSATELLDHSMPSNYRHPRPMAASEWYGNRQSMLGGLGSLGDSKNHNDRESLAHLLNFTSEELYFLYILLNVELNVFCPIIFMFVG